MSERPTPETDALDCELHTPRVLQDRYSEMRDHAQKLERERDEAREKAERYRLEANAIMLQRDEALMDRANGDIATMTINHYERLLRERDMAEDERIDLAQQLRSEKERHAKCQNERDEAREALREIWQSGDAFLPYIDNETTNRWRKAAGWEETK